MKQSVILILLISASVYAQSNWVRINSPVNTNLNKCFFIDSLYGWVTGDSGKVLITSNGGVNWVVKNLPTNANIQHGDFLNKNSGWVITWFSNDTSFGSNIYSTSDGGDSWNLIPFPFHNRYFTSLKFVDSLNVFAGGGNGFIARTTDGGLNWNQCTVDSFTNFFYIHEFTFYNKNYGYAYGGLVDVGGIIWRTSNAGTNWEGKFVSTEPIRKLHFFDSLNVFAIGGDAEYGVSKYITKDAGKHWSGDNLSFFGIPYNMVFRTKSEAWIPLGFVNSFLVTVDSGNTWQEQMVPEFLTIYDIAFPDSLHGYAVGLDGVILKYKYSPMSIKDAPEFTFKVNQNYPNPFNPETIISFSLQQRESIKVTVYDVLGKEIKKFVDKEFSAGYHELVFNGEGLSSGVYIYIVTGKSFSETKKMLLIR